MTEQKKHPSDLAERFQVRMPTGLRDRIAEAAKGNGRSMNSEIVARLEASLAKPAGPGSPDEILYVLLDTDGMPISWAEIFEHLSALNKAGRLGFGSQHIAVVTSEMISSTEREDEATQLARKYRALLRKRVASRMGHP